MLLVNQNNVVDAKSVNASLIALKNQADKLNRQIATLEKSIKSLDGSKADEKDLSNYYTKDETYNKQSIDDKLIGYEKLYTNLSQLGISTSTTTIANVWEKLPNNAEAKLDKNLFTDPMPNTDSAFILFEKLTIARGKITYYTKDNNNTYLMCLNSSNLPTGTWQKLATEGDLTNFLTNITYKNLSYTFTEVQGGNTITIATTPQVKNLLIVYTSIGTAYFTKQEGAEWQYLQVFTNALTQYGWEIRFRYLWETRELSTGLVSKGASADFPTIYGYRYN